MRRPCEWSQGAEGFSRLVIKPGLQWWECQILTARPQGPAILEDLSPCFFEEEFCKEMEGSEASKVFIRSRVCVKRTHEWTQNCAFGTVFQIPSGQSSCSLSLSGLTQGPPQCICASFSQDGFWWEGFWEVGRAYYGLPLSLFPDSWGSFLHMCGLGGLLDP